MKKTAKGWKLFKCDEEGKLYCRPGDKIHYFEKGKWYSIEGEIEFCKNGFHFHENIADLNRYYSLQGSTVCEIACKDVLTGGDKSVCRSMKITKILNEVEKIRLVNSGRGNTGIFNSGNFNRGNRNSGHDNGGNCNSGHYNSGSYNSGNSNSGSYNSGYYNSGNNNGGHYNGGSYNSGHYNSGHDNSGNRNSGDHNSGSYNSGNRNSGNWNSCSFSCGALNTITPHSVRFFNKEIAVDIYTKLVFPKFMHFGLTKFIPKSDMTKEEKKCHPEFETAGGYLKTLEYKEAFIKSFNKTNREDVEQLLKLPNFDYDIFEEISGISKEMIERKLKR